MHQTDFPWTLRHFSEAVNPELCWSEEKEKYTARDLHLYWAEFLRLWKEQANSVLLKNSNEWVYRDAYWRALDDHMYSCSVSVLCGLASFSAIPHFLPKCLSWLQWKKQWRGAGNVLLETLTSSKTLHPRTRSGSKNVFGAVHASVCNQALDAGLYMET